jgi:hypothetical protein
VKNYFTRYLGTIKGNVAILLTFSAHNRYYAKYSSMFDKAVQSVAVKDTSNLISPRSGTGGMFSGGESISGGGSGSDWTNEFEDDSGIAGGLNLEMVVGVVLLLLALVIGGLIWYRKKKNG